MIPTTPAFDAARSATGQTPIVVVSFPALGIAYSNRPSVAGLAVTSTFAKMPAGLAQQVSDLQGNATIGALNVTIVDVGRALLATLGSHQWYGALATVQLGFAGLTYPTDFITPFTGVVQSVVPTDDHTGFVIGLRDFNRRLTNQIYATGDDGFHPTSATNPKTLDGNPMDLVLDVLEGQLGLAAGYIDTAAIAALKAGRMSTTRMLFSLQKAVNANTFLEQELLRPHGLFHFARYNGALSVADMLAPPTPVPIAFAFTQSNTLGIPAYRQQPIYNWVQFDLDYDGSNFLHTEQFIDAASVAKFDLQAALQIQSQGLRTNYQGASRAGITARRIFERYAGGPANQISLAAASLQPVVVEVGDYVTVTHPLMENLDTGTLGWTGRVCQVLNVQQSWASAQISFDLIDVTAMLRPVYQYAPDSVPAWPAASSGQKATYMFMADSSSQQSDGSAAAGVF